MRELYRTMVNNIYVVNINDSVNVRVGHNDSEAVYDLVNQQRKFRETAGYNEQTSRSGLFLTYSDFLCPYLITPPASSSEVALAATASGRASPSREAFARRPSIFE
jgi:hypothetical protein